MSDDAPRVLIVKTSSMGDVIHALPVASDVARAFPAGAIDWVVEEGFAALPALHPAVRRVARVALRRWRGTPLAPATWRELRAARRGLREAHYTHIVDCQGLLKSAWIARWGRGPSYGFDRESAREPVAAHCYDHRFAVDRSLHAIDRNRRLAAAALGYTVQGPPRFGLVVPALAQPELAGPARRGRYAVLLTNASRVTKLWPAAAWRAVEQSLAARGLTSFLVWGSAEENVRTRERAAGMRQAVVAPRSTLDQLAALLAGASVVVGIDTGLTHLAAAVGARTVGIFCDYDPRLVGVTGDADCVSLGGASGGPDAGEVLAAVERLLDATADAR
jgi:heptosyltransferase-1